MINIKIEKNGSKYLVLIKLFDSNRLFKEFTNIEDAKNFEEEFYLNYCLYLMYGTDDERNLEKYSKKTYKDNAYGEDYETYKESNIGQLFSRKIEVNSNLEIEFLNERYKKIDNISDINFLRNDIKYKYLRLDKIRKVLKKILLVKSKKQGGFNLTNLNWDHSIPSKLCNYLFPELITNYSEEETNAIKKYMGYYFGIYNDLLNGNIVNITKLDDAFIDSFFTMLKCFRTTPYDLYLYRGAKSDKKHCQKGNEFEYKQFVSTSVSAPSTITFVNGEEYQLVIPKGTKVIFNGFSIDGDTSIENEVILLPSKFIIKEEKNRQMILKYQESFEPCNLLLDNLLINRDYYIESIGDEKYQHIYNYVLKKSLELKKSEVINMKELNGERVPGIIDEISLLFNYYGVYNQKDNYSVTHYHF